VNKRRYVVEMRLQFSGTYLDEFRARWAIPVSKRFLISNEYIFTMKINYIGKSIKLRIAIYNII